MTNKEINDSINDSIKEGWKGWNKIGEVTSIPNSTGYVVATQYPSPCPGCGRCPYCGRPYYAQPYVPYTPQPYIPSYPIITWWVNS